MPGGSNARALAPLSHHLVHLSVGLHGVVGLGAEEAVADVAHPGEHRLERLALRVLCASRRAARSVSQCDAGGARAARGR